MDENSNQRLIINKYIVEFMEKSTESNLGLLELYILNQIHSLPIVVLFNDIPKYFINKSIEEIKNADDTHLTKKHICINMDSHSENTYPYSVNIIYYK